MDSWPLRQDNILGEINTETPHQEPQKMCTRNTPCLQQGCLFWSTPTSHVRNLGEDLDSSNASSTPPTTITLPWPPADHPILLLTSAFQNAIQTNNMHELEDLNHLYRNTLKSHLDFLLYDRFNLIAIQLTFSVIGAQEMFDLQLHLHSLPSLWTSWRRTIGPTLISMTRRTFLLV